MRHSLILPAVLLAAVTASAQPASAQKAPPVPVVAVIDVQAILRDSAAMKGVRKEIQGQLKKFQAEITKEENAVRASGEALEKQRTVLAPDAFDQKQRELQQKIAAFQRKVQNRRQRIDKARAAAADTFQKVLVDIVKKMAKERNYNLVLAKNMVVHTSQGLDITKDALARMNKRLPKLKVKTPNE